MKTIPDVQPAPWRDFCCDPPYTVVPRDGWIEIHRLDAFPWPEPQHIRLCDMPPWMNVAGLSWRRDP